MFQFEETIPEEWNKILTYLNAYPRFSFRSGIIAPDLGMSSHKVSKIPLQMYRQGMIDRLFTVQRGGYASPHYAAKK